MLAAAGTDSLGWMVRAGMIRKCFLPAKWDNRFNNRECRSGKQTDYIKTVAPTRWTGIDAEAKAWEKFLFEIFQEDTELTAYIQRLFGYSITGKTTEHILPILWGQGRNGKGTLLEILQYVLGPLAGPIQSEMLLDQGRLKTHHPQLQTSWHYGVKGLSGDLRLRKVED